jgi:hypothetical protein
MDQKYGRREGADARFGRAIHRKEFNVTVQNVRRVWSNQRINNKEVALKIA